MHGLTVRWSLAGATDGIDDDLREYVESSSYDRFSGKADLRFKTWRMRPGEWFEGCYVFETSEARGTFEQEFTANAAESPVSKLVGSAPIAIEPCEIVGVAEGAAGFKAAPSYR